MIRPIRTFVKRYQARINAVAADPEYNELVAAVRAGFQVDMMQFTPTERRGLLTAFNRQETEAQRRAEAEARTR